VELVDVATRVAGLGEDLDAVAARLRAVQPGARAVAADGPGALFAVGAALHSQWSAGIAARERELTAHGQHLAGLAMALRTAAGNYQSAEESGHWTQLGGAR